MFFVAHIHAGMYTNPLSTSRNLGWRSSLPESSGISIGHATPMSGSFHRMPDSWSGEYSAVTWYSKSTTSLILYSESGEPKKISLLMHR